MGNSMRSTPAPPERPVPSPDGLDSDFLAVLSDYPSPDISPPIFRCGEKLRVISDEGGWWKAISLSTGRESYIPGICVARVYHGLTGFDHESQSRGCAWEDEGEKWDSRCSESHILKEIWLFEGLGRDKAEELLQLPDTKIGSFMIRESETKKGFYSLSVRHRQVKHYRIFRLPNNWYYISPRLTFQCLEDLVNHYSVCVPNKLLETRDYTSLIRVSLLGPGVRSKSSPPTKIGGASKTAEAERGLAEGTVQRTEPEEDL
ncbi:src-like-adapter-like protein [Camelus ferus]|nr:src-like-adapter-like protein [Camelus ferus]